MLDAHQLLWTQIAAGVCLLIFGGFLFNMFRMRGQMRAAGNWDRMEGVITVSKVDQPPTHVSDDLNDATPIIHYRYRAGGQDIEGDQISVGGAPLTTRVLALRMVARYPVGARVDVHVDPNDPKNALLEPDNRGNLAALIAFTIVFGLITAVLVAHSIAGHVLYTDKGVPLFVFPLPVLALLGAVFCIIAYVRGRQLASASARWPTAAGIVTTSDVIEEAIEEKDNDDKSRIRKIYRYQLDLRYAYQVGKRDFVGTAANWGATAIYGLRDVAEKAAAQYHKGQPVTVHYDPDWPGQAVLEPDDRQGSLAPLIGATICAVFGGVMLTVFVKVGFGG
jgi:hypothetical protein